MIRVLVVDDHPAIRSGLAAVLGAAPGIVPVGCATGEHDLWTMLNTTRPDLIVLDYHLGGCDGLRLCRQIKARLLAPKVLIYSVHAGPNMSLPAIIAGADGLLEKGASTLELHRAITSIAAGTTEIAQPSYELVDAACARVSRSDVPIIDLLLEGASQSEIAAALATSSTDIARRVDRILLALGTRMPSA